MLPLEIVNYIFLYFEGSTNQIMKNHINNIQSFNNETVCTILTMNMDFGYVQFNYDLFKNDY
jgi:hypothetical protein